MKKIFNNKLKIILTLIVLSIIILITGCNHKVQDIKGRGTTVASDTPIPTITQIPSLTPTSMPKATTTISPTPTVLQKAKIPILYYHAISDEIEGMEELFVSPKEFEKQMAFLKNNGYETIGFNEIANAKNYKKPIIITLDDGYENNYTNAYPILKKNGFKATIFLVSSFIEGGSILKKSQIKEMTDIISFEGHSIDHPDLTKLSVQEIDRQLKESKDVIEKITGKPIEVFAYPTGYYNASVLEITKKYYKYAVLNGGGMFTEGDNLLEIKRIYVPRNLNLAGFEQKIKIN